MSERRDKPKVGFWCSLLFAVMLVAYPLCIGPASWLMHRARNHEWALAKFIESMFVVASRPMFWLENNGAKWIMDFMVWYSDLFR